MAELGIVQRLSNEHDATKNRVIALEGGAEETAETLEEYGKFIVFANGKLAEHEQRLAAVEERKAAGIPDWFMNADPEVAGIWLEDIGVYTGRVLRYFIKDRAKLKLTACWPWHPRVVDELLISMCHYRAAHRGGVPTPAADMRRQWLDGTVARVNGLLEDCAFSHKEEYVDTTTGQISREWTVDNTQLPAYLTWWCTSDREGIPPGLRRKT